MTLGCLPDDLASYSSEWSPGSRSDNYSAAGASAGVGVPSGDGGAAAEPASPSLNGGSGGLPDGIGPLPSELDPSSQTNAGAAGEAVGGSGGAPALALPDPCADGVVDAAGTTCYLVAAQPTSWQGARAICEEWAGALVKVESPAEDLFIGELVTDSAWLGGSDTEIDNVFVWTDGSAIEFGSWGFQQPDRFPGPDCVEKRQTPGKLWFDQPCFNERLFICEKPIE
jgi:hypothetical protein